ncbi:MAG: MFS transporter, partial [Alphaproteobacteria bacterium]
MPSEDQSSRSSVQTYIDETPVWSDGTVVSGSPMTRMQWRIWSLAAAGKFFEGMVVFMTGVALPLIGRDWGLDPIQTGVVGAASLFGILVGASTLGGLADRYGRRSIFIIEMALFCVFLALLTISTGYW